MDRQEIIKPLVGLVVAVMVLEAPLPQPMGKQIPAVAVAVVPME